jgi:hypothetical protein
LKILKKIFEKLFVSSKNEVPKNNILFLDFYDFYLISEKKFQMIGVFSKNKP